jgi:hypothetical protein
MNIDASSLSAERDDDDDRRDAAARHEHEVRAGGDAPAARALQLAWITWVVLVLLSLAALAIALVLVMSSPPTAGSDVGASRWSWVTGGYLVIALPTAFFWRSRQFRGYWHHEAVAPRKYLLGMSAVWVALAVGAALGAVGCVITRTLVPNAALAAVALVTMLTLWPKGTAMTRPVGNPGDVGEYEEPK